MLRLIGHGPRYLYVSPMHMKTALYDLIGKFNDSQRHVMAVLAEFGIRPPSTNVDWSGMKIEDEVKVKMNNQGITIFKHGYGISFKDNHGFIDFDFGANGEMDGFDPNRLINYAKTNGLEIKSDIKYDLDAEVAAGNITYSGYINYYVVPG